MHSTSHTVLHMGTTRSTYDAVGNLARLTYPNGVATRYSYTDLHQLTELAISAGTLLGRYTYTLDNTGARRQMVDETGRTVDYGYDASYRLRTETITSDPQGTNGSISYTYDATGNRLSRSSTVAGVSNQSFSYDANDRLTGGSYDANGNTLTAGSRTYRYDDANRLVGDGSVTLGYDGDGHLVAQTSGGITTTYLVDERNPTGYAQIVEEQVQGQVQQTFTYGLDLISLNTVSGGSTTPHFVGYDGLGSVRLLADSSGAVTDRYAYDAFGGLLASTGSTPTAYRFTGERYSRALGLYYLRARWYNPGTGRFLTLDTYAGDPLVPPSLHKYLYAHADPVNQVDPSGLVATTAYWPSSRIQAAALPGVLVTGLAVACVYRLTASYLATALEIAMFGGTFKFDVTTRPCTVERKPPTCETKYPDHRKCSEFPPYYKFWGITQKPFTALDTAKAWLESPMIGYSNVTSSRPMAANDGPCGKMVYNPALGTRVQSSKHVGTHYDLHAGGRYIGSAIQCQCCQQVGGEPVLMTRCAIRFTGNAEKTHQPKYDDLNPGGLQGFP